MLQEPGPRKLATIMSVDLAGYSAMAEADEAAAIATVERVRAELAVAAAREGGRIFNTAGDGFMLEFASASGALAAAEHVCAHNDCRKVRIGLHLGDVMTTPTGDLLGHGVNVAARLQQLAAPGAVIVSVDVRRAVRGAMARRLRANGVVRLDKMEEAIETFVLGAKAAAVRTRAKPAPDPVLAVLPFDNENDGGELDFFSEGVADEIMLILMRQSALKIVGRTSAFQFRGARKSEAGQELRASHVLDGAVRRRGSQVRINTQLIDAGSGVAVWSARYDRQLANLFELQDDIAGEVASALKHALIRPERAAPIDPAAYDLYLRARRIWLTLSDIEEEQAETLLERCVERAPDFAPAWATLASVRAFLLPRDRDVIGEPAHQAAVAAAERALELDPDCPLGFLALSLLKPAFGAHAEKLALVGEALKRTPNDPALHVAHAAWLYGVGRIRDAMEAVTIASALEPLGPAVESLRASLLSATGQVDAALDVIGAAWARWPDSAFIWYMMWGTLCVAERHEDAEALAAEGVAPKRGVSVRDIDVLRNYVALLKLPAARRREACDGYLASLSGAAGALPLSSCIFAASFGDADHAFDVLERALDSGRPLRPDNHDGFGAARAQAALQVFVNTGGEPFYRSSRFANFAARIGLAEYWLSTGHWPDCAETVDYDFKAACEAALAKRA